MIRSTFMLASAFVMATAGAVAVSQQPARPQTTFKTGVDLVSVDVNVVDRDGRPIENLTAADFSLAVDGKPRPIASAEFIRLAAKGGPARVAPTHYSSNANASGGRLVMLAIDQGSLAPGRARGAIESAMRFVKTLSPADRIGLFAIPGPGPQINFTANHELVLAQLPRIVGQATASVSPRRVGVGEAARIDRGDQMALSNAVERECSGENREMCSQEIQAEARDAVSEARHRTRTSLAALRTLMQQLAENDAPKTLVFISEMLAVDDDHGQLGWAGPIASKGRITVHALRVEPPQVDAGRRSANRIADAAYAEEGLSLLADLGRGSLFRVIGNADRIFDRLAREMSAYYLLGFEPDPVERDGKPHKIRIQVTGRRGVEVRSRQDFSIEARRALSNEDVLKQTIASPLPSSEILLNVTTYTFREAASQKLRVLIAAEIDRSQNPSGRVSLAYALMDPGGTVVSSHYEPDLTQSIRDGTQHYVAAAAADAPGLYVLKLAVVDDSGRRGSVEHAFRAGLTNAGPLRAGDLLIGDDASAGSRGAAPAVTAEFSGAETLHGYLELYGDSTEALDSIDVTMEVVSKEDSRALETVPGRVDGSASTPSRRVVESVVPIGLLPPGDYIARANITVGGRRAAQVARPFRVVRADTADAAATRGRPARPRAPGPLTFRIEPFQRATVLAPDVVGFFVDRLAAGERPLPPGAVEHARGGRFAEALEDARSAGHAVAAPFLEGLTLYARGELEAAARKFRDALREDSAFFPAAFYLGACYAAGGRERDASAAWQTSLVTESDAPFVYSLLADSLLRQRSIEQALDVLKEASGRWPENADVQRGLAAALGMAGQTGEALRVLDTYLAGHPDDLDRLFLALRIVYDAHASGRPLGTADEDRARFEKYAGAYASKSGPQLALVEQWRKAMSRR